MRKKQQPSMSLSFNAVETVDISAKKERAEMILLGAMLREPFNLHQYPLNTVALSNASGKLAPVFAEILKQYSESGTYSPTTIAAATGSDLVFQAAANSSDVDLAWSFDHYTTTFNTWASIMALSSTLHKVTTEQFTDGGVFEYAFNELAIIRDELGAAGIETVSNDANEFAEIALNKMDGIEPVYKTTPHTYSLSQYISAFKPGYLTIIAARPGMGKTQFACNLLSHFADQGAKGVFFSLEMSAVDLRFRLIGIRHGITPDADWTTLSKESVSSSVHDVATLPIRIIDNQFSVEQIESTCVALHAKGALEYLLLDYLQLAKIGGRNYANKNDEVGAVSAAFVRMSKRFKIPVIALSQLSRSVESRSNKRPQMSDLRDSGALEQDASNIIFLYRDEYYGNEYDENGMQTKGIAEAIVAKQRNGRTGTSLHSFNPIRGYRDQVQDIPGPSLPKLESFVIEPPKVGQEIPF